MPGAVFALVWSLIVMAPASPPTPSPTPIPNGIQATFVALSEQQGATFVTFAVGQERRSLPLAPGAIARERAVGGEWKPIDPSKLRAGAPVVVFQRGRSVTQIDTLYAQVATRFVLVKNGYGVAPSGTIYRLVGRALDEGAALPQGAYVLLRVAPGTTTAFELAASSTPFADEASRLPKVTVTVDVLVPVNTPSTDVIYMSTDALSWTPNAIRMSPLPGNRWTVTLSLTQGTQLKYKYTRGSWQTDERDLAGNEIANRNLSVNAKGPTQTVDDSVARWADRQS
jgi:hypothetical protein